jgi:hypothetical protein
MYKQATVSTSNYLKPSLQELLGPGLSIILIALSWIMKTFLTDEDWPQKIIALLIYEQKCAKQTIHNIFTFTKGNNWDYSQFT